MGLKNFVDLIDDLSFRGALKNTVVYACISVPVQTTVSLCLAAILAKAFQKSRFGNFVRSALFVPVVCSATVVASVWYILFTHDPNGFVNQFVALFGIPPQNWLGTPKLAYDPDRTKRRAIHQIVIDTFPEYIVFIGGSSSFDMAPKPYDKFYALAQYCKEHGYSLDEVAYFGDDYGPGGNDESIYLSPIRFIPVDDYTKLGKCAKEAALC